MRGYLLVLLSLCTLSVVAIIVLQPEPLVRFEAELSRMPPEQALQSLDTPESYQIGQRNIALVHVELLTSAGKFDAARDLLDQLAIELPLNTEVRKRLEQIAFVSGDTEQAVRHAELNHAAQPTTDRRMEMGFAYRLLDDAEAEIAVLQSVAPETLTAWEADRLTKLLVAQGDVEEAEKLYALLAGVKGEFADEARKRLIVLHVDEGRGRVALKHAMDWYAADEYDPAVFELALPVFLSRGAVAEAVWLAERVNEIAPENSHRLVRIFSASGHRAVARRFQDFVLAQSDGLNKDEWSTLIQFAALTGDLRGLQSAITSTGYDEFPEDVLPDAFLQLLRYQGPRALAPFRQKASPDLARSAPLVAAAFAVDQSHHKDTVTHLIDASKTDLTEWDRAVWISIAKRLEGTGYDRRLVLSPELAEGFRDEFAANLSH